MRNKKQKLPLLPNSAACHIQRTNATADAAPVGQQRRGGMSFITDQKPTATAANSEPTANTSVNSVPPDETSKQTGNRERHCKPADAFFLQQNSNPMYTCRLSTDNGYLWKQVYHHLIFVTRCNVVTLQTRFDSSQDTH